MSGSHMNRYRSIAKAMNAKQITAKRNRWAFPWQVSEMFSREPGTSLLSIPQRLREMAVIGYLAREFMGPSNVKAFTLTDEGVKLAKAK